MGKAVIPDIQQSEENTQRYRNNRSEIVLIF